MRRLFFVPASLILLVAARASAQAEDCGNITAQGVCQDAKTLVFCEDGELETIRCQSGELCAIDADRFNGAASCIATRYTGCGAVPEQGLCAGTTLLYCANGTVEELECPVGTRCEAVGDGAAEDYDCVAASGMAASTDDDHQTEPSAPVQPGDDTNDVDDPTPIDTTEGAPLPSVQKGGAPAEDVDAGGGSCAAGMSGFGAIGPIVALITIVVLVWRRRR